MEWPKAVNRFATFVERRLGLAPVPNGGRELEALLAEKSARSGLAAYLEKLEAAGSQDVELRTLAERLTVGETYFFRHMAQLQALVAEVLPRVQREGRPARVLCAGCSSGEEAYSVAILGRENPHVEPERLFITGVDVNPRAIERARKARYAAWSLRSCPEALRERWFHVLPNGDFEPKPSARERVHFEERNLLEEDPAFWAPGSFDVILCRNVTLYFTPEVTRAVIARLERALTPGGALLLGPSETPRGFSDAFEVLQVGEAFYHRRKTGLTPAPVPRSLEGALPPAAALRWSSPGGAVPALSSWKPEPPREPLGMEQAWRLLDEERYTEAQAWLEQLPEPDREQSSARLLRAVLHFQGGHFPEAERVGESLVATGRAEAAVYYLLGLCREQAGDEGGARNRYARAVHLEPTFALGHLRLGILARRAQEATPARVALRLALTLLAHEQPLHLTLFGGGFGRHGLMQVCQQELRACAEVP
ncbi:methyltransferase domain-containing protein [Stigmatella sp. ncwal1]|uniref:Methyltransferase domain-containing protein n=1 Tax=Stigmatella ashevillensis TaxID=2995309 RepID=A0ABT5DF81_9BACT|nr:CheR family methyltransferase [Stigmatella ashevillena]MDC0712316.1 methyltransferase domain-containing protein [Stigmatella ashevillena]